MAKRNRKHVELMKRLDPFESLPPQRRYEVFFNELNVLQSELVQRGCEGREGSEFFNRCGGRLTDVRARIAHIEKRLEEPAMRHAALRQRAI